MLLWVHVIASVAAHFIQIVIASFLLTLLQVVFIAERGRVAILFGAVHVWVDFRRLWGEGCVVWAAAPRDCLSWLVLAQVMGILLSLNILKMLLMTGNSSSLNRCFKVLAVDAFAVTWAENSTLIALTVLLETSGFLASAALCVKFLSLLVACRHSCLCFLRCFLRGLAWILLLSFLAFLGELSIYLWAESIWCLFQSWSDSILSYSLEQGIILAWIAIAALWRAINPGGKAFTVEL